MQAKILAPSSCGFIAARYKHKCRNLGLWFNYFIQWKDDLKPEKEELQYQIPSGDICTLLQGYSERRRKLLNTLDEQGYCCRTADVHSESRLAVGMGNPNPIENGLTFQYPLGFPIIPGSSLKGVTASYAADFENQGRDKDNLSHAAIRIFGANMTDTSKGSVLFLDAFPLASNRFLLECDIINPHYEPYYSSEGRMPPADYYAPIPNKFLTVAAGVTFCFQMASRSSSDLNLAWKWLKNALADIGVGGKTQVGYGRFCKEDFDG